MLFNFSWVIPNKLAGSNMPGGISNTCIFDSFELIKDLLKLKELGINTIFSIVEELPKNFKEQCKSMDLEHMWFPVNDFDIPNDLDKYRNLIDYVTNLILLGKVVTVHCKMGIGRTGTTLACIIGLLNNFNSEEAIKYVRHFRPNSIENQKQIKFIQLFLDKKISESNIKGVFENDEQGNRQVH